MKTMMLAAAAALSLTAGAAFADGEMMQQNQPVKVAPAAAPVVRDAGVLHTFSVRHTSQDPAAYLLGGDGGGN